MFRGGDETGSGRLVGLGVSEVSDRVSLDERRRYGPSWSRFRRVRQQVARVVDTAQVTTTALLLRLVTVEMLLRRCRPTSINHISICISVLQDDCNTDAAIFTNADGVA